jgi:hypothetical protein
MMNISLNNNYIINILSFFILFGKTETEFISIKTAEIRRRKEWITGQRIPVLSFSPGQGIEFAAKVSNRNFYKK